MNIVKTSGLALVAVLVIAGCSRDDDDVMVMAPMEEPIYAKDGTVIGMRPTVGHSGMDDDMDMMDDDDDDDSDG